MELRDIERILHGKVKVLVLELKPIKGESKGWKDGAEAHQGEDRGAGTESVTDHIQSRVWL